MYVCVCVCVCVCVFILPPLEESNAQPNRKIRNSDPWLGPEPICPGDYFATASACWSMRQDPSHQGATRRPRTKARIPAGQTLPLKGP